MVNHLTRSELRRRARVRATYSPMAQVARLPLPMLFADVGIAGAFVGQLEHQRAMRSDINALDRKFDGSRRDPCLADRSGRLWGRGPGRSAGHTKSSDTAQRRRACARA